MKVMFNRALLCFFLLALFSCQKELSIDTSNQGGSNDDDTQLNGTWKFVNLTASSEATVEAVFDSDKFTTITKYNTVTENNTGTITFDGTNAKVNNLGYKINTELTVTDYLNGVQEDEFKTPFTFSIPPVTTSSKYQLIGSDSLYFPGGAFVTVPDGSGGQMQSVSQPSGAKFSINGNTLLFTGSVVRDTTIYDAIYDQWYDVTQKASQVIKLERQ